MNELNIFLDEEQGEFEPGTEIAGKVSWTLAKPAQSIELRLFWFTRGKGTEDAGLVQTTNFEAPLQQESRSFRFQLPDSPYSFSGKLISLVWALELVAHPGKEVVRREFEMGPGGKEVRLDSVATPGSAKNWLSMRTR